MAAEDYHDFYSDQTEDVFQQTYDTKPVRYIAIVHETAKARLFDLGLELPVWIPKSVHHLHTMDHVMDLELWWIQKQENFPVINAEDI